MKQITKKTALALGVAALAATSAQAGNIILTGHDVDFHLGQNGFDAVALDYVRDGAAKATYDIIAIGSAGSGSSRFTGGANITGLASGSAIPLVGTLAGYGSAKFYDASTLATDAGKAAILAGADAIVILSYIDCGGCTITPEDSDALNTMAPEIALAFNAGTDLYVNTGASRATFYDFLPPGAVVGAAPIFDSTGFSVTPAGTAIGLADVGNMINGNQTHNKFTSFAGFTVFEQFLGSPTTATDDAIITIGLKGGTIVTGGIVVTPDAGATGLLLGLGLIGLEGLRRRIRA